MNEPIAEVLGVAGEELNFGTFQVRGLPGFELVTLYKGETSLYEVTKQDFLFNLNSTDITLNSIAEGMSFILVDSSYTHTFKVSRPPQADLTGWSVLFADYEGKVNV